MAWLTVYSDCVIRDSKAEESKQEEYVLSHCEINNKNQRLINMNEMIKIQDNKYII